MADFLSDADIDACVAIADETARALCPHAGPSGVFGLVACARTLKPNFPINLAQR